MLKTKNRIKWSSEITDMYISHLSCIFCGSREIYNPDIEKYIDTPTNIFVDYTGTGIVPVYDMPISKTSKASCLKDGRISKMHKMTEGNVLILTYPSVLSSREFINSIHKVLQKYNKDPLFSGIITVRYVYAEEDEICAGFGWTHS